MYIRNTSSRGYTYYTSSGQQAHTSAPFLLLFDDYSAPVLTLESGRTAPVLYAIVRKVALVQFGHFMMGTARIANTSYIVSGQFGNDGLPSELPETYRQYATRVPDDIARGYWQSDSPYYAESLTKLQAFASELARARYGK